MPTPSPDSLPPELPPDDLPDEARRRLLKLATYVPPAVLSTMLPLPLAQASCTPSACMPQICNPGLCNPNNCMPIFQPCNPNA